MYGADGNSELQMIATTKLHDTHRGRSNPLYRVLSVAQHSQRVLPRPSRLVISMCGKTVSQSRSGENDPRRACNPTQEKSRPTPRCCQRAVRCCRFCRARMRLRSKQQCRRIFLRGPITFLSSSTEICARRHRLRVLVRRLNLTNR